ncbi:AP-2 adaptor complex subunit alpha [Protomyces lactucae-debilis]|uniref:AP-2 complex subunit alpha n=1 Tax=Protomyces lactucae-debilis TaxID=2754530 RepID=A0A1Y2FS02_PROLT|nr:AP-2 adaptor complex subunit alpha [Protomyces lactucae-debilis]ORY86768.1 AP-2 adaptor complex subunit alpha [Protomyces lactucae-debilis]
MSSMRGLTVFISDLRNARARELEEKRINTELAKIRIKFKDAKLNGYDRKKYICKLLYMYILGWDVAFGHLEALKLLSSVKYSEKQIGYLAVTLFLNENHDMLHLVVNSIRKDLLDSNDLHVCLALHCIANIGGVSMGESLSDEVHRLLIAATSSSFIKKKAALTLLRLYRKCPSIIQRAWAERIVSILDDDDLGVVLSVLSLVSALAQDHPDAYIVAFSKAVYRLKLLVLDQAYGDDDLYYRVPNPWLQVKLLRLLQYFPAPTDAAIIETLIEVLNAIVALANTSPKNAQQNNAQNAILFEAINLAVHADMTAALETQPLRILSKCISSRETNTRFLGLETLSRLAARSDMMEPLKKHQDIVLQSLKDRDISVRRRGLDLLFSICDSSNAKAIVAELVKHLQQADFAIREELVLKIAILVEKYATEYQWYVAVMLQLLAIAGDQVPSEVWQRIVQVVTNNEELQEHASTAVLQYLKQRTCHENLVKVGGYILGEFGHLIGNNEGCTPIEQFSALHGKFNLSTTPTRALLLSTYVKFVNLFPEIKDEIIAVFRQMSKVLDAELQQRACEYLALVTMPTDDLLQVMCEEMPPFPERVSALLSRLHSSTDSDTRISTIGGREGQIDRAALKLDLSKISMNGSNSKMNSPVHQLSGMKFDTPRSNSNTPNGTLSRQLPDLASAANLSPGWEAGYHRLLYRDDGLLYDDPQIQIGLRSEYGNGKGFLTLVFTNKSDNPYTAFTTRALSADTNALTISAESFSPPTLPGHSQVQQRFKVECLRPFAEAPLLRLSYLAGALQALTLKLPVVVSKFAEPVELTSAAFFESWAIIGGGEHESQRIFGLSVQGNRIDLGRMRAIVKGHRMCLLESVDPNPNNVVAATIMNTLAEGKIGVLLRLEPNLQTTRFRITVRAKSRILPSALQETLSSGHLANGSPEL